MPTSIDDRVYSAQCTYVLMLNHFQWNKTKLKNIKKTVYFSELVAISMHAIATSPFIYQYLPIERELWVHLQKHGKRYISIDENKYILKSTELYNFSFPFFSCWRGSTEVYSTILGSFSFCFRLFLDFSSYKNEIECHHIIFFRSVLLCSVFG